MFFKEDALVFRPSKDRLTGAITQVWDLLPRDPGCGRGRRRQRLDSTHGQDHWLVIILFFQILYVLGNLHRTLFCKE